MKLLLTKLSLDASKSTKKKTEEKNSETTVIPVSKQIFYVLYLFSFSIV